MKRKEIKTKGDDFQKYLKKQLKDPEFRKEYEDLEPLYALIKTEIAFRLKNKITQEDLAKRMGTSQSAIARFEAGNVKPSVVFIFRIAKALGGKLKIQFEA